MCVSIARSRYDTFIEAATYLSGEASQIFGNKTSKGSRKMYDSHQVEENLDVVKEVAVEKEAVVVVDAVVVEVVDTLVGNSTMEWTSLTLLGSSWMKNRLVWTMKLVMKYDKTQSARLLFKTGRRIRERQQQLNWVIGLSRMTIQRHL